MLSPEEEALQRLSKLPLRDDMIYVESAGDMISVLEGGSLEERKVAVDDLATMAIKFKDLRILSKSLNFLFSCLSDAEVELRIHTLGALKHISELMRGQEESISIFLKEEYLDLCFNLLEERETKINKLVNTILVNSRHSRPKDVLRIVRKLVERYQKKLFEGKEVARLLYELGKNNPGSVAVRIKAIKTLVVSFPIVRSVINGASATQEGVVLHTLAQPKVMVPQEVLIRDEFYKVPFESVRVLANELWNRHPQFLYEKRMFRLLEEYLCTLHYQRHTLIYALNKCLMITLSALKGSITFKEAAKLRADQILPFDDLEASSKQRYIKSLEYPHRPENIDILLMKPLRCKVMNLRLTTTLFKAYPPRLIALLYFGISEKKIKLGIKFRFKDESESFMRLRNCRTDADGRFPINISLPFTNSVLSCFQVLLVDDNLMMKCCLTECLV